MYGGKEKNNRREFVRIVVPFPEHGRTIYSVIVDWPKNP